MFKLDFFENPPEFKGDLFNLIIDYYTFLLPVNVIGNFA